MSDLITAAESIRRMAVTFQGIGQVADALESVGKLDQVISERQKMVESVTKQVNKLLADRQAAEDGIAQAEAAARQIVEDAEKKRDEILVAANASASDAATKIVNRAEDAAKVAAERSKADVTALSERVAELNASVASLSEQEAGLLARVDAATKAADDAEKRLDALKDKLKSILA